MMRISSSSNPHIRDIRKLRSRKERNNTGTFFLEGIRIVAEAVEQKANIQELIFAPELLTSEFGMAVVHQFQLNGGTVIEVGKDAFVSLAQKENPQGLAAVAEQHWMPLDNLEPKLGDVWVLLDTVRDPGNLGTILRTLDAIGGSGVILLDETCDPYDPTAIRASMGAVFTQRLVKTSFEIFAAWKQKNNFKIIGTSDHEGRFHYRKFTYPDPVLLLMGSERAGLSEGHISLCDAMVMIPMVGACDSLNLSVAAGVLLYEIYEQQHGLEGKA